MGDPTEPPTSGIPAFLRSLVETGRVNVSLGLWDLPVLDAETDDVLVAMDASFRLDAPGASPALDIAAARFGAIALHEACRFVLNRAVPAEVVSAALAAPHGLQPTPEAIWSVDLCLRYLPDVLVLARHLSPADPLVRAILDLGIAWPLSGVGMGFVPGTQRALPACLSEDPSLKGMLIDRIVIRRDPELAAIPWIAEALSAAAGAYPELLTPDSTTTHG